ncbi:hypothetical protein EUX98_g1292 [Antrodiella citrinella]|uniref:TLC domain-containing protein n=1 Tax=Antrodiella citrinella TaxID=2447956 RepID=A0A4S4N1Z0_9APHY|nr:hypothetical protein EUX98_g1292 [Antrodiella citrinella]
MASPTVKRRLRPRSGTLQKIETDRTHHLAGPFMPQTPFDSQSESGSRPPTPSFGRRAPRDDPWSTESKGLLNDIITLRWVVVPESSFKLLMIPIVLWANWELLAPYVAKDIDNPFSHVMFISHYIPESSPDDPRYRKGYFDLLFIAYWIIVWSWFRQIIILHIFRRIANYFRIKKEGTLLRYGEQGHAMVYFAIMGAWGYRVMSQLPTYWYRTDQFWIEYPYWQLKPELKAYYLVQAAYWCQQLLVLILKLEKPRKDYAELIAHHIVTLWLVGWSYITNMTLTGNAVYMSMDIPDAFLAFSKLLNYMQYERSKTVAFAIFVCVWSYFRHYLNIVILWSVWTEFDIIPETSKRWCPEDGVWMVWWMKYQVFGPIFLLQLLQLYWYFLILRILYRAVVTSSEVTDTRSDDEDDDEEDKDDAKKEN